MGPSSCPRHRNLFTCELVFQALPLDEWTSNDSTVLLLMRVRTSLRSISILSSFQASTHLKGIPFENLPWVFLTGQ